MANRYAVGTGNWNDTTTVWSDSDGGAPGNFVPVNGDAVFLTATSGAINVTTSAAAACTTLTCTGYTGTLTLGAGSLTVAGDITLVATMTLAGTSTLTCSAAATITSGGISGANLTWTGTLSLGSGNKTINSNGTTWPSLSVASSITLTLASALQATTLAFSGVSTPTLAGAFDITVGTVTYTATNTSTLILVSGQTLTVSTALLLAAAASLTVRSSTASSASNLVFNGSDGSARAFQVTFTDIAYSGATVTDLDNWYGGTLTRTSGITNRTSADIGGGVGTNAGVYRTQLIGV